MMRWVVVLGLLNVVSALAVVFLTQSSREQFVALQQARGERDELQVRWESLALERSTLGDHGRVADRARDQLRMQPPGSLEVMVLPQ